MTSLATHDVQALPALAASESCVDIAGAPISSLSFEEAVGRIVEHARAGGPPAYVVTPNAQHVSLLHDSPSFRNAYAHAWLSVADGVPLVWASKLLGTPLKCRVNGTDLFVAVCGAAPANGLRVFLMGGRPGAAQAAARLLEARFPGLMVAGTSCPPLGFDTDPVENQPVIDAIRAAAPHVLFVALGAPKQELWMNDNAERAGVPVSIGVGGSFELVSGMVARAPRWMQRAGLEWLYRLIREPRRLWKRYAVTNARFIWYVMRQYFRRTTPPSGSTSQSGA